MTEERQAELLDGGLVVAAQHQQQSQALDRRRVQIGDKRGEGLLPFRVRQDDELLELVEDDQESAVRSPRQGFEQTAQIRGSPNFHFRAPASFPIASLSAVSGSCQTRASMTVQPASRSAGKHVGVQNRAFARAGIAGQVQRHGVGPGDPLEDLLMDLIRAIELRSILGRVEVGSDTEVAILHGVGLHGQGLGLSAASVGMPFGEDLRTDGEDRDSEQQTVPQPWRLERKAQEALDGAIERRRCTVARAERAPAAPLFSRTLCPAGNSGSP